MAGIEQKQYSTGDAWNAYAQDANGWIDISTAYAIKLYGKSGATSLGPLTFTAATKQAFTASTSKNTNELTSVSAFTNITDASTITGPGIPAGALVGSYDTVGGTITMVDSSGNPVNATATATGASLTANVGLATHTPTSADVQTAGSFNTELAIHWDNTNTSVTIIPNKSSANPTITIDSNVTGSAE